MIEKIWDYLDNKLSTQEEENFLVELERNASLKKEFESCRALHHLLQAREIEHPSMAFARKIQDKLQNIPPLSHTPLVSVKTKKIFWALISTGLGTTLAFNYFSNFKLSLPAKSHNWLDPLLQISQESPDFFTKLAILTAGMLSLILLDKVLSSRSGKRI